MPAPLIPFALRAGSVMVQAALIRHAQGKLGSDFKTIGNWFSKVLNSPAQASIYISGGLGLITSGAYLFSHGVALTSQVQGLQSLASIMPAAGAVLAPIAAGGAAYYASLRVHRNYEASQARLASSSQSKALTPSEETSRSHRQSQSQSNRYEQAKTLSATKAPKESSSQTERHSI